MALKIIGVLVVILAGFGVYVAMQPADFTVERSATMAAPPAIVFAQVNDFHNWPNWSPWEKLDPAMEKTFSGAPAGTGAAYAWSSKDKNVGAGQMTITSAKMPERIDLKLDFLEPFKATNNVVFNFTPEGEGTKVNWAMSGQKNFVMKAFCLFQDMDKMVGADFEKGLSALAATSETKAKEAQAQAAAEAQAAQAAADAQAQAAAPAPEAPKVKAKKR
ncbi:MAG: SRPBCC family protein [Myxococcota bacterium]|nr:SRPBCC family protein [Myxococcota bacterium]